MTTELAINQTGTALNIFDDLEGKGFQNVEDVQARAFIQLCNHKNHLGWTEGIDYGDIFNTLTQEIHKELLFIPCDIDRYCTEFTPDLTFVTRHPIDGELYKTALANATVDPETNRVDYKTVKTPNGNSLQASHDVYALISPDNGHTWMEAVIPMQGSKLNPYKRFFKTLGMKNIEMEDGNIREAGLYENICHLSTVEKKQGGNDYYNYRYKHVAFLTDLALATQVKKYVIDSSATIKERQNDKF